MSRWSKWRESLAIGPQVDVVDGFAVTVPSFPAEAPSKLEVNAEIFLEVRQMHTARIVARDELGLQVAWRELGEVVDEWSLDNCRKDAARLAAADGWEPEGEWATSDEYDWVMLKPLPFVVKFVCQPQPDEYMMELARQAGYLDIVRVLSQVYDVDNGWTLVSFEVNEPPNQVWQWGDWFE